jgi:hypothetical protein
MQYRKYLKTLQKFNPSASEVSSRGVKRDSIDRNSQIMYICLAWFGLGGSRLSCCLTQMGASVGN